MGKSISYSKRELEKKREQKRKQKQKRKDERKANSGGSFEDMIAYVDENGVISSTPPDPNKKEEVNVDDIAISAPKKPKEEKLPLKGRVEHFKQDKGYGFIRDIDSEEKYFFHITNAFPEIDEGVLVSFELEKGPRGMNAVRITPGN